MSEQSTEIALREPPEHMPDSHPDSLGYNAVRGDMEAFEEEQIAERLDREVRHQEADYHREEAFVRRNFVKEELRDARIAIKGFKKADFYKRQEAAIAITRSMPYFQYEQFNKSLDEKFGTTLVGMNEEDDHLIDWITEEKAPSMPDSTEEERRLKQQQEIEDDQRLLNFYQYHNNRLAENSQSEEFVGEVNWQKEVWRNGVAKGIQEGWLHPDASRRAGMLDSVRFYEGDYFTTDFHSRGGYYRYSAGDVLSIAEDNVEAAVIHEINHIVLQTWPEKDTETDSEVHDEELGLELLAQTWGYEAVTEELTQSFKTGEFGRFDLSVGVYIEERGLLNTILQFANRMNAGVSFADFTRAYTAPASEQRVIMRDVESKLDSACQSSHIFATIGREISKVRQQVEEDPEFNGLMSIEKDSVAVGRVWKKTQQFLATIESDAKARTR